MRRRSSYRFRPWHESASAAMAGYSVVSIPSSEDGCVDIEN
ncbi:MAG: hypothetical protein ACLTLQ_08370 [[Clostridium] scindens]